MKDFHPWVRWGLALILAQENPSLVPFTQVPMEVKENGTMLVHEEGAMEEDDAMAD